MPSMSELRSYKETEYHLTQRLREKERLERKAHRGCQEAQYQEPYLTEWTESIKATLDIKQALYLLAQFIKEIESR